ncbi:hypothetical protein AKJ16_DCAP04672 [Drosera capensis]
MEKPTTSSAAVGGEIQCVGRLEMTRPKPRASLRLLLTGFHRSIVQRLQFRPRLLLADVLLGIIVPLPPILQEEGKH